MGVLHRRVTTEYPEVLPTAGGSRVYGLEGFLRGFYQQIMKQEGRENRERSTKLLTLNRNRIL
jgi:hypothetical protein